MTRYVVILGGDVAPNQVEQERRDIENCIARNQEEQAVVYASAPMPITGADRFIQARSPADFLKLIEEVCAKVAGSDELVIYTTGSGNADGICVSKDCSQGGKIAYRLSWLPGQKHYVFADQNYGIN